MKNKLISNLTVFAVILSGLTLQAQDKKGADRNGGKGGDPRERIFREWDKNKDGVLEKREVPPGPREIFEQKDSNGDGKITLAEHLGNGNQPPGRPEKPTGGGNSNATFTIKQTWDQEPAGYNRPVFVTEPSSKMSKTPVIVFFHGNGGSAGGEMGNWAKTFPNHLVVVPQGYLNSWNIQGESSKAPDVEFFKSVIAETGKRYRYADMKNVSLIGSSNGAAYIYRIMIEVQEDLFKNAVPMVSSLLEAQYSEETFWKPSGDTANYDTKVDPVGGRNILYLHGTSDKIVPIEGGLRGGKALHLSAYETAFIWAQEQGYAGVKLGPEDGKDLGNGLLLHEYEGSKVSFIAVQNGGHGLEPHRDAAIEYVRKFLTE